MNGEFQELYNKLKTEINDVDKSFVSFEASMSERWKQHDDRSHEFKKDITQQIDRLDEKASIINDTVQQLHGSILQRPCNEHQNEMKWIKGGLYLLYTVVVTFIGFAIKIYIK